MSVYAALVHFALGVLESLYFSISRKERPNVYVCAQKFLPSHVLVFFRRTLRKMVLLAGGVR